jgi:hypothetical protein
MGKGLTNELKAAFPDLIPANELGISNLTLSLFLFFVLLLKSKRTKKKKQRRQI